MSKVQRFYSDSLPYPRGHYSHASIAGGLMFVSGQLPFDREGKPVGPGFAEQTEAVLANLMTVIEGAGATREDIVKVTVFIAGIEHWPEFDTIYAATMGDVRPARSVVPVPELHYGFLVELEAVVAIPG
ncbi:RidA family protein [Novosphingobium clariflavum]|uniref:RidA family protein n=1 Tax=Novosphingobium clariflavum TaxID=2029884 RepID=A0ABV6SBV5_9SPHN|nr:RidA family protein [Novosphingobium clariflavum]